MSDKKSLTILLKISPKIDEFLEKQVKSGLYGSKQEYIRTILINIIKEEEGKKK
jgi:Arc/MetJ-type ribon-helix-helix transcriptional regulator